MNNDVDFAKELLQQHKSQRRWLVAFACVSFLVLIIIIVVSLVFIDSDYINNLQNQNVSVERNFDYLQFVVPVLLAMGAFMAAALGINRLKSLDDQIEKIESRLEKKFAQHEKSSEASISAKISTEIEKKAETYVEKLGTVTGLGKQELVDLITQAKNEIGQRENSALGSIQNRFDGINNEINNAIDLLNRFNSEYAWLKNNSGAIDPDSIVIESVADAHSMVEGLFRKADMTRDERARQVRVVVQKIISKDLTGDTADYHNLSAELARNELKDLAIRICNRGLDSFPEDEDLIADIIQYATQIGEKTAGVKIQDYVDLLLKIDKKSWTWRCFEFLADYYISQREYKKAEEICKEYTNYLPRDERGYAQLAEVYGYIYTGIEAEDRKIEILEKAVSMGFACPRCANSLAALYADRGELEKAIRYSSTSILSLAQDQPSINYAYVIYNRALYEDRLFLKKRLDGITDQDLQKNALADYKEAIESNKLSLITSNQAKVRYNMLAGDNPNIKKYSTSTASAADILSVLSQLSGVANDDSDDDT